jgi:hypothetical protein
MIIQAFIDLAYTIINGIIRLFPVSSGFPPAIEESATLIGGYVGIFSPIISASALAAALALVFSVEIGVFGFKTFKWVLSHIPVFGGRG